jgi:hypothetical protein
VASSSSFARGQRLLDQGAAEISIELVVDLPDYELTEPSPSPAGDVGKGFFEPGCRRSSSKWPTKTAKIVWLKLDDLPDKDRPYGSTARRPRSCGSPAQSHVEHVRSPGATPEKGAELCDHLDRKNS